MRRRDFIAGVAGSAATWPIVAHAQQGERVRRLGVLTGSDQSDPQEQERFAAFRQSLQQLGWTEGRNIRFDFRSRSGGNIARVRKNVAEIIALGPDVILVIGSNNLAALQEATRTVSTVFVGLTDPVGAGFVESLARPGGNTTGFTSFEYGLSVKWLELLKEIAPSVALVGVVREPGGSQGIGFWAAMQGAAPSLGVELRPIGVRDAAEIERAVAAFAQRPNSGLIVLLSGITILHRGLITTLATQHRLSAVYPYRYFATSGGLLSYGPDLVDQHRRAAGYVDRILRGEKPAELPVQSNWRAALLLSMN